MRRLLTRLFRALLTWLSALLLLSACAHGPTRSTARYDQALAGETLYRTGVQLADQGDLTRGEQYLSAALRSGHAPDRTLKALVTTCVRAGRLRSALSYATPYLADHPGEHALRLLVASLYFALHEHAPAEQQLRTLLFSEEHNAQAHYLLALLLEQRRDARQASVHFQRYLELAPHGPHAEEAQAALAREQVRSVPVRRARS